jgi:hypothetical protein
MQYKKGVNNLINFKPINYSLDNEAYIQYFVGFLEADGCFLNKLTGNQKTGSFVLAQHILDKDLLDEINKNLGLSNSLYFNINQPNAIRLKTTNITDFTKLHSFINGKLITSYRFNQFFETCKMFNLPAVKSVSNFLHPA